MEKEDLDFHGWMLDGEEEVGQEMGRRKHILFFFFVFLV